MAKKESEPLIISEKDLPPEALNFLGQDCDPNDCSACPPDPHLPYLRFTCQFVKASVEQVPAMIMNARKGDLIFCPGDGRGSIGTLLGALQAPQVYTHMGIMIEDYTTIRHSTAIQSRMQAYPVGSLLGKPEPLDGFDPEKVKFGWPGTLTQTVDEAFQAQHPGIVPSSGGSPQTPPYLYCDRDNGTQVFTKEDDANHCFNCNELSFNTVFGNGGDRRDPLVVSPCTEAEIMFPELRQILHSIADEAKGINGHYRFYAYTDATIAQKSTYFRPGAMPVYHWDMSQGKWVHVENQVFDPSNPCIPPSQQPPVQFTVPVVCSSLPWLAVQNFNARQQQYFVILDFDHDSREPAPPRGCVRLVQPNPIGDVSDPQNQTPDGLYFFTQADRAHAANAFNTALQQKVKDEVADAWNSIAQSIEQIEGKAIPVLAILSVVLQILSWFGWVVAAIAAFLGISLNSAAAITEFFTKLPTDVANQICNAFVSDNASDYSSDNWKKPGVGRAVGPDDIIWFWDPTLSFGSIGTPRIMARGIYGQNRKLILQQPGWGTMAKCQWALSTGTTEVSGFVTFKTTNKRVIPVGGALVKIACEEAFTNSDGLYFMVAPTGNYWASARWQDPLTGDFWSVQQEVKLPYGGNNSGTDFVLNPPPVDFREVNINVSGDAVEGSIWASGYSDIGGASGTIYLGPRGNPANPNDSTGLTGTWASGSMIYQDTHQVQVDVQANLSLHGFVVGTVTTRLQHDSTNVEATSINTFGPLQPGGLTSVVTHLESGDLTPDEADVTITISNDQGYGPAQ